MSESAIDGRCVRFATVACIALFMGFLSESAIGDPADEQRLLQLWKQRSINPGDHKNLLAACSGFKAKDPKSPFVAVSQTMAAWHLLKLGRHDEAVALLTPYQKLKRTPLLEGASRLAKAWLTRMDMLELKEPLQFFYRKEVRYPESLVELTAYKALPQNLVPKLHDRWGMPWRYRLVGMKHIPGLHDQKYRVVSSALRRGSDFEQALAIPYGDSIRINMPRMLSTNPDNPIVEIELIPDSSSAKRATKTGKQKTAIGEGVSFENIFVAYIGTHIVLVCDYQHWKVLPKPRKRL